MSDKSVSPSDSPKSNELKTLEQALAQLNPELFKNIPETKKKEILKTISITQKIHSGPIPSPETLGEYEQVIPGSADRILTMAEKQQNHRMSLERKAIWAQLFQSQLGQIFGFLIAIAAVIAGWNAIMNNHEVAGSIVGGAGVTGLVSLFIKGNRRQAKSLEDKN